MSLHSRNLFELLGDEENYEPIKTTKDVKKPLVEKPVILKESPVPRDHREKDKKKRPVPVKGREYDRKSGTGRRDDGLKKQVTGKGSWGNPVTAEQEGEKVKDELKDQDVAQETQEEVTAEPEENLKTLGQYLAEKSTVKSAALGEREVRKANEGSDDAKWKDAVVLEKEEEVFYAGKVIYRLNINISQPPPRTRRSRKKLQKPL
jgi:plasminogen activator inhibitor 1 RNA-binding protein